MEFNIKEELNMFLDNYNKDKKIIINSFISDEFPKTLIGNPDDIKNIIDCALTNIKSNMVEGTINLDLNCMQYDKGVGLYLSIMTKCTKIKKEELDINKLKELVDNVEGNLLVDNSDKGIIIMIDFAMESIIEE